MMVAREKEIAKNEFSCEIIRDINVQNVQNARKMQPEC